MLPLGNSRGPTACVCGYKMNDNQAQMLCSGQTLGYKYIAELSIILSLIPSSVVPSHTHVNHTERPFFDVQMDSEYVTFKN